MPKPATLNATVALIRKSQLVSEDRLHGFLREVKQQQLASLTPGHLLAQMVEADLLTTFQAEQLSCGRFHGFVLGKYRILDLIGQGGMGQIYRAEHTGLGTEVALKVLSPKAKAAPLAHQRFLREASAAAKLSHPNIVRIYDINPNTDPPYLVMEFIDGMSLQSSIARTGNFSVDETAFSGKQIALGLQHIHEAGLVHRDIKPANILMNRQGIAKILDLGIVYIADEPLTALCDTDTVLGTLDYIAPEQATSSQVDIRADIYSLGATLYFLLAGHPPFPGGDARSKVLRIYNQLPVSIAKIRPDVPGELAELIHRMLAKDPDERFATPQEVADALGDLKPPANFPQRIFEQTTHTVSEEGTQTDAINSWLLQPTPTPSPRTDLADAQAGTVEIAQDPTVNPQPLSEMTLRTQLEVATAEAIAGQNSNPDYAPLSPNSRQDRLLQLVGWSIVASVVLVVGVWTIAKLLTAP